MPKRKYQELTEANSKWDKLKICMDRWAVSSERKRSKSLTSYLDSLRIKRSDTDQSRLKEVDRFLDLKLKEAKVDGLKSRLTYLNALKNISMMHWVILKLHKDGKSFDDWMLGKLATHYVLKFEDSLKYVYDNECTLRSKLQDLKQTEYEPLEGQSDWLHVQRKAAKVLQRYLRGNPNDIKILYEAREKELASAISGVENSCSAARFLSDTKDDVRVLVQVPSLNRQNSPVQRWMEPA